MKKLICPNDGTELVMKPLYIGGRDCPTCPVCGFTAPDNVMVYNELFAWVSVDEHGNEGIVGLRLPNGMPSQAVSGLAEVIEAMRPAIEEAHQTTGQSFKLIRFCSRNVLDEVK